MRHRIRHLIRALAICQAGAVYYCDECEGWYTIDHFS